MFHIPESSEHALYCHEKRMVESWMLQSVVSRCKTVGGDYVHCERPKRKGQIDWFFLWIIIDTQGQLVYLVDFCYKTEQN